MALQKIYCSSDYFKQAIDNRVKSRTCYIACEIMSRLGDVIVNLPKAKLAELLKTNKYVMSLYKRANSSILSKEDWVETASLDNVGNDIYLVGPSDFKNHENIRNKYGCLILSYDQNDNAYLTDLTRGIRNFTIVPKRNRTSKELIYEESWDDVFEPFKLIPVNAMILTDNFMFGNKFEVRKEKSLFAILKAVIPCDLETEFHLTLFFCNNDNQFTKSNAIDLVQQIKQLNLCKNIKISIVAHTIKDTTHDREIVTNYHYIYSGKGFSVIDNTGIQELAKGEVKSVYCNIDYVKGGETVKHIQKQVIDWLQPIYDKQRGMSSPNCYIVGDDFRNRLFGPKVENKRW